MSSEFDPVAWATAEAERLRTAARDRQYHASSGEGWVAAAPLAKEAQVEASGALELLRRHAGDSDLYRAARDGLETSMSAHEYLERLARVLGQFVAGRTGGLLTAMPFEVAARVEGFVQIITMGYRVELPGAGHGEGEEDSETCTEARGVTIQWRIFEAP